MIIPGGGLEPGTSVPQPWVKARLDAALQLRDQTRLFIVLSQGTTHRPPPINTKGFPISEASASAKYLLTNGITDSSRVLLDNWSLDTIGNAFFARSMICEPMALKRCCVITNSFHMPRTRHIFHWVFNLDAWHASIDYHVTADVGMSDEQVKTRVEKERASMDTLVNATIPHHESMAKLASFVFQLHGAYASQSAACMDFKLDARQHRSEDDTCGDPFVKSTY